MVNNSNTYHSSMATQVWAAIYVVSTTTTTTTL